MTSSNHLTEGAIERLIERREIGLKPNVQLMATKRLASEAIRGVIYDGERSFHHLLFNSDPVKELYAEGRLSRFTVIRLDDYDITALPSNPDQSALIVKKLTIVKPGEDINHQLEFGENFNAKRPRCESPIISFTGSSGSTNGFTTPTKTTTPTKNISPSSSITPTKTCASTTTVVTPSKIVTPTKVVTPTKNLFTPSKITPQNTPIKITPQNTPSKTTPQNTPTKSRLRQNATIKEITPYGNAWVIRVRVVKKTPVRPFNNARNSGKVFNFDVCDETGEIRVAAFTEVCDKFFDLVEVGKTYLMSRAEVKPANKKYNSLSHDYEINLNKHSIVELDLEGTEIPLPKPNFNFITLNQLENKNEKELVDVIGVIQSVGSIDQVVSRKLNKELTKREVSLVDNSLTQIQLTLWNDVARNFDGETGQILAIKSASVGEFQGKTLSSTSASVIQLDPDIPESTVLRSWCITQGLNQSFTSLGRSTADQGPSSTVANTRWACQINANTVADNGNTYFSITGIVEMTNRPVNMLYKACGVSGCKKKVADDGEGMYHCGKCHRRSPTFEWALLMSIKLGDVTGSVWITLFQENAERLIGHSVAELASLMQSDESEFEAVVGGVLRQELSVRAGARIDQYNGERRVRVSAYQIKPVLTDPVDRTKRLFSIIDTLASQLDI